MQNIDIAQQTNHILTAQNYLEQNLNQLLIYYQQTESERKSLALWEQDQNFSILGIIEVLTDEIRGYALQIISEQILINSQELINQLNNLKIFELPELTDWYFSPEFDYPKLKYYLENLNYLRLLIIEYIRDFKLEKTI